ncbi:hypothetical protein D3C87_304990 [compost metagenome]|nr:hypothetical protein [Stenotrophomonas sp.]
MLRPLAPILCLAILVSTLAPAHAQPAADVAATEVLLRPTAADYVQGYEATQPDSGNRILEFVPNGQDVRSWTELLTVQQFRDSAHVPPREFLDIMGKGWMQACPDAHVTLIHEDVENGYPIAVAQMICPRNPQTGKPEYTWVKGIQGQGSLYVVQKAFRFVPEREQVTTWVRYLGQVKACNEKGDQHPCP